MKYSKEDIINRLMNGESIDNIAKELENLLNGAKTDYDKHMNEKKAKEAAKAEKVKIAKEILVLARSYCKIANLKSFTNYLNELTEEDIMRFFDDTEEASNVMTSMIAKIEPQTIKDLFRF